MGTKITVREVTRNGRTGWEAIVLATVPTTITIGLRPTAADVVAVLERMQGAGMLRPTDTWTVAA